MSNLYDRAVVFILSFLLLCQQYGFGNKIEYLYGNHSEANMVTFVLLVFSVTCFLAYIENKKCKKAISAVYAVAALFVPPLSILAPNIVYDIYTEKQIMQGIILLVAMVRVYSISSVSQFVFVLMLAYLSCMLSRKTMMNENLKTSMKQIRDDIQEKNLQLSDKNRHLIENQDYEVYVATLKERNRIAREIHDNVGHMLTRAILQMGALMTIHKEEPLSSQLDQVKQSLDTAMNNIRESVHDLHDESVDLNQVLGEIIAPLKEKFDCRYECEIPKNVDRKYKYAIIGIVKEATSNIIKYSRNDKVDIILREHPAMYQIIVHDYVANKNKTGDKVSNNTSSPGIGLQNIRDRVEALKGNVSITNVDGFKLVITFPK